MQFLTRLLVETLALLSQSFTPKHVSFRSLKVVESVKACQERFGNEERDTVPTPFAR